MNGMDKKIFEKKEVMEASKEELKRDNEELQDISREISYFLGEINKKTLETFTPKIFVEKSKLINKSCRS